MGDQTHNISKALEYLAVPVETLTHLPGNPRESDVDAIAASYQEFGQLNAIICVKQDDEIVVLAGNHQLMAARDVLGWTHIAAVVHEHLTQEQALAFAVLDNHWGDVGDIDESLQYEMLEAAGNVAPELFDMVGWDDFEIAAMESNAVLTAAHADDDPEPAVGWVAPEIVAPGRKVDPGVPPKEEATTFEPKADTSTIVTQGSTATSKSGSSHAVIQYTLVFDSPEQQSTWYAFLRYLKYGENAVDGETTSEQITNYIRDHVDMD